MPRRFFIYATYATVCMALSASGDEGGAGVSTAPVIVTNPFVKPQPPQEEPQLPAAGAPAAEARGMVSNPFAQPSPPPEPAQKVENPFAGDNPRRRTPLRWGPVSRWRTPTGLPLGSVAGATIVDGPTGLQPIQQPPDLEPVGSEIAIVATEELSPPPDEALPPDPVVWQGDPLTQPSWIDTALKPVPEPVESQNATRSFRSPRRLAESQSDVRPWMAPGDDGYDPFEEPETEVVLATDQSQDVTDRTASAARDIGAAEYFSEAQKLASAADTPADLTTVVTLARQALDAEPAAEVASAAAKLAAWALNRRGELADEADDPAAAYADFNAAIELDRMCWLALHNRAISHAQQGQTEQALTDFGDALLLNPGLTIAYRNRAELLASVGRTKEALADFDTAIEQMPEDAELAVLRGQLRHRLRRFKPAMEDLTRALKLDPQNAAARTARGNVLAELGAFQQALAEFQQAIAVDPQWGEAYRSAAWLLATCPDRRFRNPQHAWQAAQQAARLGTPDDPFIWEALAAASASGGRFDQAVRYQQRALQAAGQYRNRAGELRLALYQQSQPFLSGVRQASHER